MKRVTGSQEQLFSNWQTSNKHPVLLHCSLTVIINIHTNTLEAKAETGRDGKPYTIHKHWIIIE